MQEVGAKKQANFNNPSVSIQSWYVATRSSAISRETVRSLDLLNRRIALYRDATGVIHALGAHCPHLGSDLGHGKVIGDRLQCAFHHWRFGPDGICYDAPGLGYVPKRKVWSYPTQERWGLIWIFNGPKPLFDLPDTSSTPGVRPDEKFWRLHLPSQYIQCHPHLVIANGLDIIHYEALHDLAFSTPPQLVIEDPYQITLALQGRPRSRILQRLTGTQHRDVVASFTTIGGNLAWVKVLEPVRFYILFTGRPVTKAEKADKVGCQTQTLLFLPAEARLRFFQVVTLLYALLHQDHRVLNDLSFSPGFIERDMGLKAFVEVVNAMEVW